MGKILLTLIAVAAILVPPLLYPLQTQPLRWFYVSLCEALAVAMLISSGSLFRTAFGRTPAPPPAHLRTADTLVQQREHYTLRLPHRPEKTLVRLRRLVLTQPAGLATALSYSPDDVLVSVSDKDDLLVHRRELLLAPAARFFCNSAELRALLPDDGTERTVADYVLCGDPLFLTELRDRLSALGVPSQRIRTEALTPHPTLPDDHPSAPMSLERTLLTHA